MHNGGTGMGTSLDPFTQTKVGHGPLLSEFELRSLVRGSWFIRRVVFLLPQDMTKAGVDIKLHGKSNPKLVQEALQIFADGGQNRKPYERRMSLKEARRLALVYARWFGAGYIVLRVNGGEDPSKPLTQVKSFEGVSVLDRYALRPAIGTVNIHNPEYYQVARMDTPESRDLGLLQKIHCSRVLVYKGEMVHPYDMQIEGDGEGDSVIQQIYEAFTRHYMAKDAISKGLDSFSLFKVAISGLSTLIGAEDGTETLTKFLNTVAQQMSVHRIVVQDTEASNSEFQERSFAGVAENFKFFVDDVTAASGYPHYKIWGSVDKAALADSGGAETRAWAEDVTTNQISKLADNDRILFHVIFEALGKGVPERWEVQYPSIYTPTPEEEGAIAKTRAETYTILVRDRLITATQGYQALATGQPLENVLEPLADDEVLTIVDEAEAEGPSAEEELASLLGGGEQPAESGPGEPAIAPEEAPAEPEPAIATDAADDPEQLVLLAVKVIYEQSNWAVQGIRNLQIADGGLTVEVAVKNGETGDHVMVQGEYNSSTGEYVDRLLQAKGDEAWRLDAPAKTKGKAGGAGKKCNTGRPCGRSCIAKTKNCRINTQGSVKEALDRAVATGGGRNASSPTAATGAANPSEGLLGSTTAIVKYQGKTGMPGDAKKEQGNDGYFQIGVPDPGTKKMSTKALQRGLMDKFSVSSMKELRANPYFSIWLADNPGIKLGDNWEIRSAYRQWVGLPTDETNPPPGIATVNNVNIMRNFLPHEAFGLDRQNFTRAELKSGFRRAVMGRHPDQGGDRKVFERLKLMHDSLDVIFQMEEQDAARKAKRKKK